MMKQLILLTLLACSGCAWNRANLVSSTFVPEKGGTVSSSHTMFGSYETSEKKARAIMQEFCAGPFKITRSDLASYASKVDVYGNVHYGSELQTKFVCEKDKPAQ